MARNKEIDVTKIIERLPVKLKNRFQSLGSYVRNIIEEMTGNKRQIHLSTEDIQLIQLAALIYSLDSFFRKGTKSAREASTIFEELGGEGFQVGSSIFTKNNENTQRGEILADDLRRVIDGSFISQPIQDSYTMHQLIITLIRKINRG
jgi:hypothetical protein